MDRKIDLHTHILPSVDDGSQSVEESLEIINYLYSKGITDIVLTSHYIKNTNYSHNQISRDRQFKELCTRLTNQNVRLYLGNEVYLCEDVIELLESHEISTINNTRYMLIELPLTGYLNNLQNILWEVSNYGIIPIIAHPERYQFLQKDKRRIRELLEFNCLLQCNVDSITGKYGKKAQKLMKWLLKNNLVQFVATDTHYVDEDDVIDISYKKLKKLVGENRYRDLTYINPSKVLENEDIDAQGNLEYMINEGR